MSNLDDLISNLSSNYQELNEARSKLNDSLKQLASKFSTSLKLEPALQASTSSLAKEEPTLFEFGGEKKASGDDKIIKLNIGGRIFSCLKSTLTKKSSFFEDIFSEKIEINLDEKNNAIFLDRNPKLFAYILDFMRQTDYNEPYFLANLNAKLLRQICVEAEYYKLDSLQYLIEYSSLNFSKILSNNEYKVNDLLKLCKFKRFKFKLIYRASNDGFGSRDFHAKCDGFRNTLTLIRARDTNFVFGGFTQETWDGDNVRKKDKNAFVFSLTNRDDKPIRMSFNDLSFGQYSTLCYPDYGPTFGSGHDFYIASNSNENDLSSSNLGSSFTHPTYAYNTDQAKSFLAGGVKFTVDEIEVYQRL